MTTYTDFVPNGAAPFAWQPTLDGAVYNAVVVWNLFGQRWYLSLSDLSGDLVLLIALAGSEIGVAVQSLTWDDLNLVVDVVTAIPHGYAVGQTLDLTLSGNAPAVFNGIFKCLVTGPDTFTFPMAADPGAPTLLGAATYDVNLVAGYFTTSALIYRTANAQFEVSP